MKSVLGKQRHTFLLNHDGEDQLVNHFPNYYELTRTDFDGQEYPKESRKEMQRASRGSKVDEIVPVTFTLPTEYPQIDARRRGAGCTRLRAPPGRVGGRAFGRAATH